MKFFTKTTLFLFILQIFIRLEAKAPAEGTFGLQDFEQDVPIIFCGQTLPLVSQLHSDICGIERGIKAKEKLADSKAKTNLVLAKISLYSNDGTCYEQGIPLHEMMCEKHPYIFDSASTKDRQCISQCCIGYNVSCNKLPAVATIAQAYRTNAAINIPGIHDHFDAAVLGIMQIEQGDLLPARQDLSREISKYDSQRISQSYQYDDMFTEIEQNIKALLTKVQEIEIKSHKVQLDKFIGRYWHSEPRLLSLLHNDIRIPAFLSGIARPLRNSVDLIMLHVHSTHNICDSCRTQFTGATYLWLYEKMVSFFTGDTGTPPIFHLVVSWYEEPGEKNKIDFRKVRTGVAGINIDEVATIEDIKRPFDATTKPFVSIVKL